MECLPLVNVTRETLECAKENLRNVFSLVLVLEDLRDADNMLIKRLPRVLMTLGRFKALKIVACIFTYF